MKYFIFILATIVYLFILVNYFDLSRNYMIGATILSTIIYFNLIRSTFPKGIKEEFNRFKSHQQKSKE